MLDWRICKKKQCKVYFFFVHTPNSVSFHIKKKYECTIVLLYAFSCIHLHNFFPILWNHWIIYSLDNGQQSWTYQSCPWTTVSHQRLRTQGTGINPVHSKTMFLYHMLSTPGTDINPVRPRTTFLYQILRTPDAGIIPKMGFLNWLLTACTATWGRKVQLLALLYKQPK